jgi:hypothetical protein
MEIERAVRLARVVERMGADVALNARGAERLQRIEAARRRDLSDGALAAAARELRRASRYTNAAAGTAPSTGKSVVHKTT